MARPPVTPLRLVLMIAALVSLPLCAANASPQPGLGPPPEGIDRSTPRRTVQLFVDATRAGDFDRAAYALDLREIPRSEHREKGPKLARHLRYILARTHAIDVASISDEPIGNRGDGLLTEKVGSIALLGGSVPIALTRVPLADGSAVWVVSQATVRTIPELYEEHGPGWFGEQLPAWAHQSEFGNLAIWQWIGLGTALAASIFLAFLVVAVALAVASRLARRTQTRWDDLVVAAIKGPLRACFAVALFGVLANGLKLHIEAAVTLDKAYGSLLTACIAWLVMRVVAAVAESLTLHINDGQPDPLIRQGTTTRITVARRIVNALVLLIAGSVALLQFDTARRIGVSLLASAGIAGVAIGFAAQKVLGNLLAGLQLSISQTIRIGDRVWIENQFGFVEEISLTYVVVKTWDLRRLVLPITQLIERPFENWTRTSPELIGIVMIYADYRVPVQKVREEFTRIVRNDPDWDGQTCDLYVVDATESTLVLRCTASADASVVWDLRCRIREQLVAFLQELEGGRFLPRTRVELPEPKAA